MDCPNVFMVFLLGLATLAAAKPIMVSFGTNSGPIVPRDRTKPSQGRTLVARSPAPVAEHVDDIPNPSTYRPMVPHQYRITLYSYKPSPNLILGTPVDRKYTPNGDKYDLYRKQDRSVGVDYTGPHQFGRQDYESIEKLKLSPSLRYVKPHYYQGKGDDRSVPQIGVVYSSGVRYYVPQIFDENRENSVYDRSDEKYFYRGRQ